MSAARLPPHRRVLLCLGLLLAAPLLTPPVRAGTLPFTVAENTSAGDTISVFGVYELTLTHSSGAYANPFQDVLLTANFHSPNGGDFAVCGFYYHTDTWKVRFAPDTDGGWTRDLAMSAGGDAGQSSGGFSAVPSALPGFLQRDPGNGYRWVRQTGLPCHPLGVQTLERENYKLCEGADTPANIHTVDFNHYLDVMTGLPAPGSSAFENWSPTVPGSSSASWDFTPIDVPANLASSWHGEKWGSRTQQGVGSTHCLAVDLELQNQADHVIRTPPVTLAEGDELIFAAATTTVLTNDGTVFEARDNVPIAAEARRFLRLQIERP